LTKINHTKECRVGIGDICLSISSDDADFIEYFKIFYHHSLIDASPDFSINVNLQKYITRLKIQKSLKEYRKCQRNLAEGDFSLHDNMISGSICEKDKRCELTIEAAILASEYLPLFQDLIFKDLFYYLTRDRQNNGNRKSFLIHGCGIQHGNDGFLFLGPSGIGKSTVAKLSKKYTVLHDEVVLLSEKDGSYFIESTPYLSDIEKLTKSKAILKAGFFLKHGKSNHIENPSNSKMVAQFVQQIVPPSEFYSTSPREPLNDMLAFTCGIIESIPFFELHFSPEDDSFWEVIQKTL